MLHLLLFLGWLISRDDDARGRCRALDQLKRQVHMLRKEPPPIAQHNRVHHQQVFIDQVSTHQRTDQFATAHDCENPFDAGFEVAHGVGNITFEKC